MSGPYCHQCKYFYLNKFDNVFGECADPSKIIYSKSGDAINNPPITSVKNSCSEWRDNEEGK